MSDEELRQLIASNAKAIQALTEEKWALSAENQELRRTFIDMLTRIDEMQRHVVNMQRQMIDTQRPVDDNTADIRELAFENQRILKYLESLVNRSGNEGNK